jgi:hypothetical protein
MDCSLNGLTPELFAEPFAEREPPEDYEPDPSFDYDMVDVGGEQERAWHDSEPFTDGRESGDIGAACVYGDEEAAWRLRNSARERELRERGLNETHLRRLTPDDLRKMLAWDRDHFLEHLDLCGSFGCDEDNDEHEDICPWSNHCGHELEAHGLALHRGDPTFWERLRKLGATPEVVTDANAILLPQRKETERSARPNLSICTARRRTRARSRGRRSAPSRRTRTASRGSPDDSGEPAPAEGRRRGHHHHVHVDPRARVGVLA